MLQSRIITGLTKAHFTSSITSIIVHLFRERLSLDGVHPLQQSDIPPSFPDRLPLLGSTRNRGRAEYHRLQRRTGTRLLLEARAPAWRRRDHDGRWDGHTAGPAVAPSGHKASNRRQRRTGKASWDPFVFFGDFVVTGRRDCCLCVRDCQGKHWDPRRQGGEALILSLLLISGRPWDRRHCLGWRSHV